MKLVEKSKAIELRKRGESLTKISEKLDVSKSSVSNWVRDVKLSEQTLQKIKRRSHSSHAVEKRRESRLARENRAKNILIDIAKSQIGKLTKRELFLVGVALYWGEGSKKKRGVVEFTNSDEAMIRIAKKFFVEVCNVPANKFRGHVYLHNHLSVIEAEKYWSKISGIALQQFHKTSIQKNKNRIKKDTLPMGTFAIVICDTKLKLSVDGWIRGLAESAF